MDYEKKYKEAVKAIKELSDSFDDDNLTNELGIIFPELKESEDEKNKRILRSISSKMSLHLRDIFTEEEFQCFDAWLEKQGEQKDILEDATLDNNEDELITDTIKARGEQKPVIIPKFRVGDVIQLKAERLAPNEDTKIENTRRKITGITNYYYTTDTCAIICFEQQDSFELVEQTPWSEEDEEMVQVAINACNSYQDSLVRNDSRFDKAVKAEEWLKSLKDRVQPQPKQEWSDKDIEMINWLIRCCEKEHEELCNDRYGHQEIVSDLKRDCRKKWDWLESLKNKVVPQNRWKPSESDIRILEQVIDGTASPISYSATLHVILEHLKKLREE